MLTKRYLMYSFLAWKPVTCERTDCPNKAGKATAMKVSSSSLLSLLLLLLLFSLYVYGTRPR